jgi:hypothetical protein
MSTTLKMALGIGGLFAVLILGVWDLPAEHDRGDLTGSWRVTVRLEDSGRSTIRFVLRQDDDVLTGHYDGSYGTQPITGTVADVGLSSSSRSGTRRRSRFWAHWANALWRAPATTAMWPGKGPGAPNEPPAPGPSRFPGQASVWREDHRRSHAACLRPRRALPTRHTRGREALGQETGHATLAAVERAFRPAERSAPLKGLATIPRRPFPQEIDASLGNHTSHVTAKPLSVYACI